MPVSHLGLTVSHLPTAVSFYLAALQPLGYRYFGQQGSSIGLGIRDADFFLCQEQNGSRVTPTHIAFEANSRLAVRNCYAAALNAGSRPSGPPSYRNSDCSCFNAAIEDLDGNTIEFIFKEQCESAVDEVATISSHTRVSQRQHSIANSIIDDDQQTLVSKMTQAKSRARTALDLASTTSKSMARSEAPMPLSRSYTAPVTAASDNGGKAFMGTLLGAAAGAAVVYAMCKSEQGGSQDEAAFAGSMRSKAPSVRTGSRSYHANYSTTESISGSRRPAPHKLAIEPATYDDDDVQDIISRYTSSRRPVPQRSRTYDAIQHAPMSHTSSRRDRSSIKRAATMPTNGDSFLERVNPTIDTGRTPRRESEDDATLTRHDSGVGMQSHHSRRSVDGARSSAITTSTAKPPRRGSLYNSAANVPMPSSITRSYISAADERLPRSSTASYISAARMAIPPSRIKGGYTDAGEDSDGLGDIQTVVPEDSISCIDFKPKKSKGGHRSSRHSSKRSEAPSERTVRPAPAASKHSAHTLPVRSKDEYYGNKGGKRSMFSNV